MTILCSNDTSCNYGTCQSGHCSCYDFMIGENCDEFMVGSWGPWYPFIYSIIFLALFLVELWCITGLIFTIKIRKEKLTSINIILQSIWTIAILLRLISHIYWFSWAYQCLHHFPTPSDYDHQFNQRSGLYLTATLGFQVGFSVTIVAWVGIQESFDQNRVVVSSRSLKIFALVIAVIATVFIFFGLIFISVPSLESTTPIVIALFWILSDTPLIIAHLISGTKFLRDLNRMKGSNAQEESMAFARRITIRLFIVDFLAFTFLVYLLLNIFLGTKDLNDLWATYTIQIIYFQALELGLTILCNSVVHPTGRVAFKTFIKTLIKQTISTSSMGTRPPSRIESPDISLDSVPIPVRQQEETSQTATATAKDL